MKKFFCFVILLFFVDNLSAKFENDSIFRELYAILNHKAYFLEEKEERILDVKKMLKIPDLTENQYYSVNRQLYNEFYTYQTDSAIKYLTHNL